MKFTFVVWSTVTCGNILLVWLINVWNIDHVGWEWFTLQHDIIWQTGLWTDVSSWLLLRSHHSGTWTNFIIDLFHMIFLDHLWFYWIWVEVYDNWPLTIIFILITCVSARIMLIVHDPFCLWSLNWIVKRVSIHHNTTYLSWGSHRLILCVILLKSFRIIIQLFNILLYSVLFILPVILFTWILRDSYTSLNCILWPNAMVGLINGHESQLCRIWINASQHP